MAEGMKFGGKSCLDKWGQFTINAIFPKTEVQFCVVHQIRNSLKYVASKNKKEFSKDLKSVYQAVSKEAAETELGRMEEK